jgi:hypothetical protein
MVIPRDLITMVSGVEFAQDSVESAVVPLAHDFDPVTDQERSADSFWPRTVIDHLGATRSADVHEQSQLNVVLLGNPQHGLRSTKHLSGPVLTGVAEHPGCPVENIEPGAPADVWRRTGRPEGEVLGAKSEDTDVRKVQ